MAKRATTSVPALAQRTSAARSRRLEAILGPDWKVALPFVLPLVIIMAGLILWPFINAILLSLTVRNIVTRSNQYVGLANYIRLLSDAEFRGSVNNTIIFTVASVVCKFIVGMSIALLLNSRLPFRNVLTGLMLLPWIVPEVVTAMAWRSIFGLDRSPARLAFRAAAGHAQRDRGEYLEGHSVLHHTAARRA